MTLYTSCCSHLPYIKTISTGTGHFFFSQHRLSENNHMVKILFKYIFKVLNLISFGLSELTFIPLQASPHLLQDVVGSDLIYSTPSTPSFVARCCEKPKKHLTFHFGTK